MSINEDRKLRWKLGVISANIPATKLMANYSLLVISDQMTETKSCNSDEVPVDRNGRTVDEPGNIAHNYQPSAIDDHFV